MYTYSTHVYIETSQNELKFHPIFEGSESQTMAEKNPSNCRGVSAPKEKTQKQL